MQEFEGLAFAGGGLLRAAEHRGDPQTLKALSEKGRVMPIWRGKPLFRNPDHLAFVAISSPVLAQGGPLIFLGLDPNLSADAAAVFACDISDWSPEAGAEGTEAGFLDPMVQGHPALPEGQGFSDLRNALQGLSPLESEMAATAKALVHWHRSHRFCATCGAESAPAMGGWQRNCPDCGAQHFPRTDPVVIMLVTRGDRLLMGRSPGWPEGMYSCLAGFMEPGETIQSAVRREVAEETGVQVGRVRVLANQPWPFPASLMLGCLAEAESEAIAIDPAEIEDALWIDRAAMVEVLDGRHPWIKAPRRGAIAQSLIECWVADRLE
ncbi:NAD(+) diphosphatase [Neogemmobacter tilapiae]|uniref:NAD(+) diphosphatase n=1 Tax=Neogemmobacter tilapiae TaxID=875041 RepID=A0A918WPD8_9RHOB|nr:NAD(+) diphosphatase [Gemmobacter tilapiae]GHC63682.1 NADH pyrophosphatase [Gemmobacter tilapiae]